MPYIATGESNDPTIYGAGESEHEARADAREWIDAESDPADLTVVSCTDALLAQVREQGACNYDEIRGVAYTEAEAAAIHAGLEVSENGVATGEVELDNDDAERLGVDTEVDVTIAEGTMTVRYTTKDGVAREISEEPSEPDQQALSYDWNLRNAAAAALDLIEIGVQRDAEALADA